jgi:hypothetical protein
MKIFNGDHVALIHRVLASASPSARWLDVPFPLLHSVSALMLQLASSSVLTGRPAVERAGVGFEGERNVEGRKMGLARSPNAEGDDVRGIPSLLMNPASRRGGTYEWNKHTPSSSWVVAELMTTQWVAERQFKRK